MMKRLVLGAAIFLVGGFDESVCMGGCVVNPVNVIVKHYNSVTPQNTVESFKTSATKLLRDLESSKAQYEDNDLLCAKWKTGIDVLKGIFSVNHSSQSDLETLFTKVYDITDNGFYDVSNTIITIDSSKKDLRPLFESFWHHLLQAREIAAWWLCSSEKIDAKEIPYVCFEASKLLRYEDDAYNALWAISILGDVSTALWELDRESVPSLETITQAKKDALGIFEKTIKDVSPEKLPVALLRSFFVNCPV